MVPRHCSTDIRSVWSVHGTVALATSPEGSQISVVNFYICSHVHLFRPRWQDRARAEDRRAVKRCESDTQPLPVRLAIVNGLFPASGNRADGGQFARAAQAWHQPRGRHWMIHIFSPQKCTFSPQSIFYPLFLNEGGRIRKYFLSKLHYRG